MVMHALYNAGIVTLLSLVVVVAPMVMGIVYAWRPTEAKLALMRPLSLAALFAGLCGFSAGVINALIGGFTAAGGLNPGPFVVGLAEGIVPLFVGFGCLTVAWIAVAVGLRR